VVRDQRHDPTAERHAAQEDVVQQVAVVRQRVDSAGEVDRQS
jgi:hypothetical protein